MKHAGCDVVELLGCLRSFSVSENNGITARPTISENKDNYELV